MSETSAKPTGPRFAVPPKMTSSIFAPRSDREDCSPSTQRIASEIFDFPEPFGPTIAVMPPRNLISVRSGNDLKPCKIRLLRTMFHLEDIDKIFYHKGRQNSTLYRRHEKTGTVFHCAGFVFPTICVLTSQDTDVRRFPCENLLPLKASKPRYTPPGCSH